jgi:SNF2 family DNA or RNA helicase
MEQWQEELDSKFGIKAVSAVGAEFRELDRRPFWITSYDTARTRVDAIKNRKFDFLILDEAHGLRNLFGTQKAPQRAVAFERLMRENGVRYCMMLTATPIQNRLWDIFSRLEILKAPQPNPLGRPDEFRTQFIADAEARRLRSGVTEDFRARVATQQFERVVRDTRLLFPEREVQRSD